MKGNDNIAAVFNETEVTKSIDAYYRNNKAAVDLLANAIKSNSIEVLKQRIIVDFYLALSYNPNRDSILISPKAVKCVNWVAKKLLNEPPTINEFIETYRLGINQLNKNTPLHEEVPCTGEKGFDNPNETFSNN